MANRKITHQMKSISSIAQGSPTNGSQRTPEAVASQNQRVAGISRHGTRNLRSQGISDSSPGLEEARVSFTARAEAAGICLVKVQIGNPIADGVTASEGQHKQFIGVIHGEEARYVAEIGGADER